MGQYKDRKYHVTDQGPATVSSFTHGSCSAAVPGTGPVLPRDTVSRVAYIQPGNQAGK